MPALLCLLYAFKKLEIISGDEIPDRSKLSRLFIDSYNFDKLKHIERSVLFLGMIIAIRIYTIHFYKNKLMEFKNLEGKWDNLEHTLKLLIKNNPEPYKGICQERLDNIKKMRACALLIIRQD